MDVGDILGASVYLRIKDIFAAVGVNVAFCV
jgi:hypothetical protein